MFKRILDGLYSACGVLAALSLLAIACIIIAQIVGRLFGVLIPSADEFAGYALAGSTFLGLAYTFRANGHIRINMFTGRLSPKGAHAAEVFSLVLGTAVLGYFTWYLVDMAWTSWDFEDVSPGLIPVPLWIPQACIAFGTLLMTVSMLEELVRALRGKMPVYASPDKKVMQAE